MKNPSHHRLLAAGALIERELGVHFEVDRGADLRRALQTAAREFGEPEFDRFVGLLLRNPAIVHRPEMIAALTIGETYFYRDPAFFETMGATFLPEWRARTALARRSLRVWSAGCCTGEEAYTLAIELTRGSTWLDPFGFDLTATDLNPGFLRVAELGVYRPWSFRDAPAWLRSKFCEPVGGERYAVRAEIRARVRFAFLNLAGDGYPAAANRTENLDLILCRNVLMYFSAARRAAALDRLVRALLPGGWLVTSAAEAGHLSHPRLGSRRVGDVTVFERLGPKTEAAVPVQKGRTNFAGAAAPEPTRPRPVATQRATLPELLTSARETAQRGELIAALRQCEQLLARDRFQVSAHLLSATLLEELGRRREAGVALHAALYLEPSSIAAHFQLAALARRAGRIRTAQRHAKAARDLAGRLPPATVIPDTEGLTAAQFLAMIACPAQITAA